MAGRGGASWLKWGCLGCVGLVGMAIFVGAAIVGVAWLGARSEHVDDHVLTREVPAAPAFPENPAGAGQEPSAKPTPATATQSGRVLLDLSEAEFQIKPGRPGEPLRVEAAYDRNSYILEEKFEPSEPGGGWSYWVGFHRTRSGLIASLRQVFSKSKPRVEIFLPPDALLALQAHVSRGGAAIDLGGLWLQSAELKVEMGGMELEVSEPLRAPMDSLHIQLSMGGGEIRSLGNASPRKLDVEYSMGGLSLDLRGQWVADADVTIRGSMGGGEVRLPHDVRVEGVPGRALPSQPAGEVATPTLRFSAAGSMGDLKFE